MIPPLMKLRTFPILLFSLTIFISIQAQSSKKIEKQIDKVFAEWDKLQRPGGAVAVVKDGKIIFKKGYGSANLEYGIPNAPNTVFHIASVSKQFTTFSILLLEKEGEISLDDDVRKYIPELPNFGPTITLRHLAHHTSGLRDQWNLLGMAGWDSEDLITQEHILEILSRQKDLNFEPGEEYLYCNSGFTLLAETVARVSGKSFSEFTEERIFKPLKMKNTLFFEDNQKIVPNRAYSYYDAGKVFKKSILNFANVGATSLFTTVEDLSLWAMNFENPVVGDEGIIEKMRTKGILNDGSEIAYALGQSTGTYKGLPTIGHGGADAGYRSQISRFPEQKFSVIVFSNLATGNPYGKAMAVADIYLKDLLKEEEPSSEKKDEPLPAPPKDLDLSKYEANYWNARGSYSRKIYEKNNTLWYNRQFNESPLAPIGDDKFKMLNVTVDLIVEFATNEKGEKIMKVYENGGPANVSVAYEPADYSEADLAEFTGKYYSEELDANYVLKIVEGKLLAHHIRNGKINLNAIKADVFSGNFGLIEFDRNRIGEIVGFRASNGRVRNLRFERE